MFLQNVYLSSDEAKDMIQIRTARKEAGRLIQKLQKDKENITSKINHISEAQGTLWYLNKI